MATTHKIIETPIGALTLVAEDGVLSGVYYPGHWTRPDEAIFGARVDSGFDPIERELAEYFSGERTVFDLPVYLTGDGFQRRVWDLLAQIPFGDTKTYGEVALELGGDATLARAVGRAVGHNPISIVVPCHRVVGKSGKLTGYAGGLERKQFLLGLEGAPVVREAPTLSLFGPEARAAV